MAEVVSIIVTNKPKALEKKERKKNGANNNNPIKKGQFLFLSLFSPAWSDVCVYTALTHCLSCKCSLNIYNADRKKEKKRVVSPRRFSSLS